MMKLSRKQLGERSLELTVLLISLMFLFPVFYVLMNSLKMPRTALLSVLPKEITMMNYQKILSFSGRFPRYIYNSFINAFGGALLGCSVAALAGYAVARYRFFGKSVFVTFLLSMMMLPQITNLIPLFRLASETGLINTYTGMILVLGTYGIPLGTITMRNFFEAVPKALEESASIDGANPVQTFFHVVIPITMPGIIATFLINFVYNWNNFITPLFLLTKDSMFTATVGIRMFQSQLEGNKDELLAAACALIMVPAIILFVSLRRYFLQGMAEGAVKG